ncbi:MAG: hypothetical protein ACIAXF_07630 [Phycisphaerales bacterium JB063]
MTHRPTGSALFEVMPTQRLLRVGYTARSGTDTVIGQSIYTQPSTASR